MLSVLHICLFGIFQAAVALSPVSTMADCPKLSPQNDVKLNKLAGTWRLGFLYIDDVDDLEEDNMCGVVEIMQVNDTKMEFLLYMDSRKDQFTVERYTKAFDVSVLSPGEWLIHTSLKYLESVYVTVVGAFGEHLILSFCVYPFSPTSTDAKREDSDNFFLNAVEKDNLNDIFKAQTYGGVLKGLEESDRIATNPSGAFFRGKSRRRESNDESSSPDVNYNNKTYEKVKRGKSRDGQKHLWTAILVRSNKVSALDFVESASYLMKLGYQISKGQLVGFGSCSLTK